MVSTFSKQSTEQKFPLSVIEKSRRRLQQHLIDNSFRQMPLLLKLCLRFLKPNHLQDIAHERSDTHRCGYFLCNNPITNSTESLQKWKIDFSKRLIYDNADLSMFCSIYCYSLHDALKSQLSEEATSVRPSLALLVESVETYVPARRAEEEKKKKEEEEKKAVATATAIVSASPIYLEAASSVSSPSPSSAIRDITEVSLLANKERNCRQKNQKENVSSFLPLNQSSQAFSSRIPSSISRFTNDRFDVYPTFNKLMALQLEYIPRSGTNTISSSEIEIRENAVNLITNAIVSSSQLLTEGSKHSNDGGEHKKEGHLLPAPHTTSFSSSLSPSLSSPSPSSPPPSSSPLSLPSPPPFPPSFSRETSVKPVDSTVCSPISIKSKFPVDSSWENDSKTPTQTCDGEDVAVAGSTRTPHSSLEEIAAASPTDCASKELLPCNSTSFIACSTSSTFSSTPSPSMPSFTSSSTSSTYTSSSLLVESSFDPDVSFKLKQPAFPVASSSPLSSSSSSLLSSLSLSPSPLSLFSPSPSSSSQTVSSSSSLTASSSSSSSSSQSSSSSLVSSRVSVGTAFTPIMRKKQKENLEIKESGRRRHALPSKTSEDVETALFKTLSPFSVVWDLLSSWISPRTFFFLRGTAALASSSQLTPILSMAPVVDVAYQEKCSYVTQQLLAILPISLRRGLSSTLVELCLTFSMIQPLPALTTVHFQLLCAVLTYVVTASSINVMTSAPVLQKISLSECREFINEKQRFLAPSFTQEHFDALLQLFMTH